MAKKVISMTLSQKSVQNVIKELRSYQNSLEYKCRLLAEKLAEKGVEIAQTYVASLDAIFTYELNSSIHAEHVKDVQGGGIYAVVAGTDHALFVEFGTGIVGQQSPYPGKLPDGRYGWFYRDDNGQWWFTEGMPSRPFMYYTANELRDLIMETAKEVFTVD